MAKGQVLDESERVAGVSMVVVGKGGGGAGPAGRSLRRTRALRLSLTFTPRPTTHYMPQCTPARVCVPLHACVCMAEGVEWWAGGGGWK